MQNQFSEWGSKIPFSLKIPTFSEMTFLGKIYLSGQLSPSAPLRQYTTTLWSADTLYNGSLIRPLNSVDRKNGDENRVAEEERVRF